MTDPITAKRKELEYNYSKWKCPVNRIALDYFNLGVEMARKEVKCEGCGRTDCLNVLCHADLELIKQDVRKEARKEIEDLIKNHKFYGGFYNKVSFEKRMKDSILDAIDREIKQSLQGEKT